MYTALYAQVVLGGKKTAKAAASTPAPRGFGAAITSTTGIASTTPVAAAALATGDVATAATEIDDSDVDNDILDFDDLLNEEEVLIYDFENDDDDSLFDNPDFEDGMPNEGSERSLEDRYENVMIIDLKETKGDEEESFSDVIAALKHDMLELGANTNADGDIISDNEHLFDYSDTATDSDSDEDIDEDDMGLLGDYEEEEYYDRLISFFDDDDLDEEVDSDDGNHEVQLVEDDNAQAVEQDDDDSDWQLVPGESDATLNFYDDDTDNDVQSVEDENNSLSGFTVKPTSPSLVAGITSKIDVEGVEDSISDAVTAPRPTITREKLAQVSVRADTAHAQLSKFWRAHLAPDSPEEDARQKRIKKLKKALKLIEKLKEQDYLKLTTDQPTSRIAVSYAAANLEDSVPVIPGTVVLQVVLIVSERVIHATVDSQFDMKGCAP
eukprot:1082-Heterococcus_DN1.PRE.3